MLQKGGGGLRGGDLARNQKGGGSAIFWDKVQCNQKAWGDQQKSARGV